MTDTIEIIRDQRTLKFKCWLVAQVVLPILFALLIWPITLALFQVPDSFEQTFKTGDLILIGAMLLLGVMVDNYYEQRSNDKLKSKNHTKLASKIDNHILSGLLISIVFLFFYGFVKSASMRQELATTSIAGYKVSLCVLSSLFAGFCAVAWSVFATHKVMEYLLEVERNSLEGQTASS